MTLRRSWTRTLAALALLAALGIGVFWVVSAPQPLTAAALPAHAPDLANGERLYNAGGCRSCHKPSPELKDADPALPSGGFPLKTPIATLYPPNLTPDLESGLGGWSDLDFVNAVQRGISPRGRHYIPAFPYTSYAAMRIADVLDIKAYLKSLPAVKAPPRDVGVPLAFLLRRGVGAWKLLGLDATPWRPEPARSESWNRGSYLVSAPGHCGECHTPRNFLMIRDDSRHLAGGPHPEGEGKVPSLRGLVERNRYKDAKDLATALQFGETFGYDKLSSGGMGDVQANLAKLPEADIRAIADYLVSLR